MTLEGEMSYVIKSELTTEFITLSHQKMSSKIEISTENFGDVMPNVLLLTSLQIHKKTVVF